MNRKPLPPFGKQYLDERPRSGIQIALGPAAWDFAKMMSFIVMVLPAGADPFDFTWPTSDGVIVHECGQSDDDALLKMATALLIAGNLFVVARRSAILDSVPVLKAMNITPNAGPGFDPDQKGFDPDNYVSGDWYPEVYGDQTAYFYPK